MSAAGDGSPPHGPVAGPNRARYVLIAEVDILRSASFLEAVRPFRVGALVARDGGEAIQTLQRYGPPIILIVSISLPSRDGFAVMSALRSVAGPRRSAIIALVPLGGVRGLPVDVGRTLGVSSVLPFAASDATVRAAIEKALNEAGGESVAALDHEESRPEPIDEIIRELTTRATRLTGAAGSAVYLQMNAFERVRAHVDWLSDRADVDSPFAAPYALEWVLRTGDVLVLPDLATQPVAHRQTETLREVVRALIAVPLVGDNSRVVGALCVFDVKPLTIAPPQLEALKALGRDVGHVLEATASPQEESAEQWTPFEADPARVRDRPMSLILIRVDHFANGGLVGQQTSDQTMGSVSQIVRRVLRGSDVAIRWDASEFLILLSMVGLSAAGGVAERIRHAVQTSRSRNMPPITISGGLTELAPGEHPAAAIGRLRDKLTAAIKAGGNRMEQ